MKKIVDYLSAKITGWYENARIDYGIEGRFVEAHAAGNNLIITHEESGVTYTTTICWFADYTEEQLYNIWMESEWEEAKSRNTYTIPEDERENVLKLLARYSKKATEYGQSLVYEMGEPYATEIAVYDLDSDPETGASIHKKVGTRMVEAFDLTIESEIICKEGYTVVAKLEHMENANIVYVLGDGQQSKPEWCTLEAKCDHCGGKHGQKVTFIVRDADGNEKQVGRTCLKDYCGINPQRIGLLNKLEDLFLGMDVDHYDFVEHPVVSAYNTIDALALAIRIQKNRGYTPSGEEGSNKEMLKELVRKNERPTEAELDEAEKIGAAILSFENQYDARLHSLDNVWVLLKAGYCKFSHFGYIAYAPLAFERYQVKAAREAEREATKEVERKASEYVGEIGQRITVDVGEAKLLTSWESDWGYTYLYKIIDALGNVLIWYASRTIGEAKKLRATVKDHTERDGIKQTVVTRCSVVAA